MLTPNTKSYGNYGSEATGAASNLRAIFTCIPHTHCASLRNEAASTK